MEFNEKLFRARKDKGLSQEALAERVGVSRQAVSKWETGEAKPDTDKLCALCTALELSMDELLLGRKPAETAQKRPKKSIKWLILVLSAVLIFALGVMVGRVQFPMETVNSVAFEPEIRAQDIEIADVLIERRLGEKSIWEWHMAVMPENPEALQ